MPTKSTTTKPAARKPRVAKKKEAAAKEPTAEKPVVEAAEVQAAVTAEKPSLAKGKYVFATGRRKTAVANVRLFSGKGNSEVNKKAFKDYFQYTHYQDVILKPFQLTGLEHDYHFVSTINGGGAHAQAQALQHGIAQALGKLSDEVRKVLKKNGMLTRDDREKERKKPGLKRARRSPQWAKR